MTCIVGIQKGNTVWIGADSAMTRGDLDQRLSGEKKVFINGEFIMGVAGYPRTMSLLNHTFEPPEHPEGMSDDRFMHSIFVDAVKECVLKDNEEFGSIIMIGYRGKLYQMDYNFQILVPAAGFEAMGSGGEIAIGVLRSTRKMRNSKKRCLLALEASAENNAGVRPPFHVLKLRKGSKGSR